MAGGRRQRKELNLDPKWLEKVREFEPVIKAIATKYCSDEDLRKDCEQEARIALLMVFPERVNGYEEYRTGQISEKEWSSRLGRYCRNVIRYTILTTLDRYPTGNWYIGRTRRVIDPATSRVHRVHQPPRYSSLDELIEYGLEVDEEGNITWLKASDDGLNS